MFPENYEVGIANLGFQAVYSILNTYEHIVAERVFKPDSHDKSQRLLWTSEESNRPLRDFDLILFSVSFEASYPSLVAAISNADISLETEKRSNAEPLVLAGGIALSINPEPIASFLDAALLGEFEAFSEEFTEIIPFLADKSVARHSRLELLKKRIKHTYLTSFSTNSDGDETHEPVPVAKATWPPNIATVSPIISQQSHFKDMALLELTRGCGRGCRFCAAGFVYRPPRKTPIEAISQALDRLKDIKRVGLIGLEFCSHQSLAQLCDMLNQQGIGIGFSSIRADAISDDFASFFALSGAKTATIAPEAGSERLRKVINKNLTEEQIFKAAIRMVSHKIMRLKFYYMIGLPTETDEDVEEISNLTKRLFQTLKPIGIHLKQMPHVHVAVGVFVPKPWTPFQWYAMPDEKTLKRRQNILKKNLSQLSNVTLRLDSIKEAIFQAVLSRGDRQLSIAIAHMALGDMRWEKAFLETQTAHEPYLEERSQTDIFSWEIAKHNTTRLYLWSEWQKALKEHETAFCRFEGCKRCGACR